MDTFLKTSSIPYSTPTSENFDSLQKSFSAIPDERKPNLIALPNTAEQVAAIVKQSLSLNQEIAVRGGGHDTYRRWNIPGVNLIDLRNLNRVTFDVSTMTANVSGGATSLQVLEELAKHNLRAATGACGTVGYTGWALAGGMGPFMNSYGMGADQIVGAKVVNAKGELITADGLLLKGLRGGGGSLAIVVQLTIKVYPTSEILAGMLIFESSDLPKTVSTAFNALGALVAETETNGGHLPSKLAFLPGVIVLPGLGKPACGVVVVWNGPADDESKHWIGKIGNLAPLLPGMPDAVTTIAPTTTYEFIAYMTTVLLNDVNGMSHTATVTGFTPEVVANLAETASKIPSKGFNGGLFMHIVLPDNPSCSSNVPDSVLPYRSPHIMFELLGFGEKDEEAAVADAAQWALDARNLLSAGKDARKGTYLPLTAPEYLDLNETYGTHLSALKEIKGKVDPDNVFKHTVPKLV